MPKRGYSQGSQRTCPVWVRGPLCNFILGEDEQTLEGVVLAALAAQGGSLAVVETFTAGQIAAASPICPAREVVLRRPRRPRPGRARRHPRPRRRADIRRIEPRGGPTGWRRPAARRPAPATHSPW